MNTSREQKEKNEKLERLAINKCTLALQSYSLKASHELKRRKRNLEKFQNSNLNDELHKTMIKAVYEKGNELAEGAVERNQIFFDSLLGTFRNERVPEHLRVELDFDDVDEAEHPGLHSANEDHEKARYVLKNLVRDWAEEGKVEREESLGKLLRRLEDVFFSKTNPDDVFAPRVLVPGAGLGRLVYELAKAGFEAEGNEFSYYMLFGSSFMLNCSDENNQFEIAPYWHTPLNHLSREDQYRLIKIPDESPSDNMHKFKQGGSMSMCAGDFSEVYKAKEYENAFDAVCCCFFLDTAKNVFDYLKTIKYCLRNGGTLVSIGPLLWHWVDQDNQEPDDISIEVALDDLLAFARELGFSVDVKETNVLCSYATDWKSMHRTVYDCAFLSFTLTK